MDSVAIRIGEQDSGVPHLAFRVITFTYPTRPQKIILNKFNLVVKQGQIGVSLHHASWLLCCSLCFALDNQSEALVREAIDKLIIQSGNPHSYHDRASSQHDQRYVQE
jgi:hypothetical protein